MCDNKYKILREKPDLMDAAVTWLHGERDDLNEAYLECLDSYLNLETDYGWHLCLDAGRIEGGLGVIDNDFHDRKDLSPNICAVYTGEGYRSKYKGRGTGKDTRQRMKN